MKLEIAGQNLTFALCGKNTLSVENELGGNWEVRLSTNIPSRGQIYLGPMRCPQANDPYHYPVAIFASKLREHLVQNASILGEDLRAFLDRFAPLKFKKAA